MNRNYINKNHENQKLEFHDEVQNKMDNIIRDLLEKRKTEKVKVRKIIVNYDETFPIKSKYYWEIQNNMKIERRLI